MQTEFSAAQVAHKGVSTLTTRLWNEILSPFYHFERLLVVPLPSPAPVSLSLSDGGGLASPLPLRYCSSIYSLRARPFDPFVCLSRVWKKYTPVYNVHIVRSNNQTQKKDFAIC